MRQLHSFESPASSRQKHRCDGCTDLVPEADAFWVRVNSARTDYNCTNCAKRWYVVATFAEDAEVAARIMREARKNRLDDLIEETKVPRYKAWGERNGKAVRLKRKAWEGYVLVRMVATPDTIHLVQGVRDVIGLLPLKPTLKGYRYPKKEPKQARPVRKQDIDQHERWFPEPLDGDGEETLRKLVAAAAEPDPEVAEYELGDPVEPAETGTMFDGMVGIVTKVLGDQEYEVEFRVMGMPTTHVYGYVDLVLREDLKS